jgi:tetratricopeptide (TPR) repeat protein
VTFWRSAGPSAELAAGVQQLGEIEAARARFAEAEPHFREALELRRALQREPTDELAASARGLADMLTNQRKFDEAEPLYREAIAIERQLHGADSPHAASTLHALAVTFHDRGKFNDAEPLFREALEIYRRVPTSGDPVAASVRLQLANMLLFGQRYAEAEPLVREAVDLRRAMYPPGHRLTITALAALGALLHNTSRFSEGEAVLREALQTGSPTLGSNHPDVLHLKQILGNILHEAGRYDEADRLLTEALDGYRAREGPDFPVGIIIRIQRAENRLAAGRLPSADADFREAAAVGRRVFGGTHPFVALGIRGEARVAAERGDFAKAEAGYRRAFLAFGPSMRPSHHYVLGTKRSLAEAVGHQDRLKEADSMLTDVVLSTRQTLPGHVELARALHAHGDVRLRMGDARGAETLLREALALRQTTLGLEHWQVAETEGVLGLALVAQQRFSEARPLLARSYERLLAQRGPADRRTREVRARLDRD